MARHVKIQVFVPEDSLEIVRKALADAGAGKLGNYDSCCFITKCVGYWRPLAGSNPTIGKKNRLCHIEECRIEAICEESLVKDVVRAIRAVHPYEEPAIDVIPLLDCGFDTSYTTSL